MKSVAIRNASILLSILFLGAACTSAHVQHGAIHREFIGKRIAVFNTDGKITGQLDWTIVVAGVVSEVCGKHAAAYLETELMPHYRVAERGLLKPILEELKLNASGLIEPHTAIKIGRLAGLDVGNGVKSTVDPCSKLIRVKGRLDPFFFTLRLHLAGSKTCQSHHYVVTLTHF